METNKEDGVDLGSWFLLIFSILCVEIQAYNEIVTMTIYQWIQELIPLSAFNSG